MIIFLYGTDGYRRAERVRWWTEEYKKKHGLSPALRFDMTEDGALAALREFCGSASMFDAYKLAVTTGVFASPEPSALAKFLKAQAEQENIVIIVSEEKKPPAAFSFLASSKRREELFAPEGPDRKAYVAEEAKRRGIALDSAALSLIARSSGGDTWWIATELDRAALLGKKALGAADFPELGLGTTDVEGLLSELRTFSRGARLAALEKLLRARHDAAMIFHRIAYRDAQKIPAFAEGDVLVKSGKLDYEEVLLALAIA